MISHIGDEALKLLGRGFSVFPLQPKHKTPLEPALPRASKLTLVEGRLVMRPGSRLLRGGADDGLAVGAGSWSTYQSFPPTIDEVVDWWTRYERANVAVVTGRVSGLVVIDCDAPEGAAEIERRGGFPETLTAYTSTVDGFRKRHYYFQHPGFDVRNFAKRLPGLDLRGDGGYVMAPPSIHPSGAVYEWANDAAVAPMPDWLLELLRARAEGARAKAPVSAPVMVPRRPSDDRTRGDVLSALDNACRRISQTQGARHECRFFMARWIGGLLHYGVLGFDEALEALAANPSGNAANARKTAEDGLRSGMAKPLDVSDNAYRFDPWAAPIGDPPPEDEAQEFAQTDGAQVEPGLAGAPTTGPVSPPREPRFKLLSLAELARRAPPVMLVERVLLSGGTSLLTAKHASFKSFFSLDLGLCVAADIDFHGKAVRQGGVVYVAAEGAAGIVRRVRAWCVHHDCEFPPDFYVVDEPAQIGAALALRQFMEAVQAVKPTFIVLDTLSRCAVGLDENSAQDMGTFVEAVRLLAAETGAHVMLVHHNNKGGEYRGSSALAAAVDTHMSIERKEDRTTAVLSFEKHKDDEEPRPMVFRQRVIDLDPTTSTGAGSSLVFVMDKEAEVGYSQWSLSTLDMRVLQELIDGFGAEGATASQWKSVAAGAGITERTFYRAKTSLQQKGAVSPRGEAGRGEKYRVSGDWCHLLPLTANGSDGSDEAGNCHLLPHPFRGGSDGSKSSGTDDAGTGGAFEADIFDDAECPGEAALEP